MSDHNRTRQELVAELTALRESVAALSNGPPQSEELYRGLVEACPDAVVMSDLQGKVLFASRRTWQLLGLSDADELVGSSVLDYVNEHDRPRLAANMAHLVQAGLRRNTQYTVLRKDGVTVPVEASSAVIRDAQRRPRAVMAIIRDISQRVQAEEALHASDEHFRVAFEEAPMGMVIAVGDGTIARVNRSMCRMSGYSQEEVVGKALWDFTHPEDREISQRLSAQIFAGEIPTFTLEKRYLGKTGAFWAETTVVALHDAKGNFACALGIVQDISARKQAEAALRQSERRFRNYFEQGLIGMGVAATDKRWLEVNHRLCEILGRSREELLHGNWVELTHPDDLEANLQLFEQLLAGAIEHFTMDKRFVRKDGSIVYTTIHIRAFRNEDRSIDHIVSLIEDITARTQAEQSLRQSYDELRTIYEQVVDGIIIADAESWRPVRANSAYCRMLGYTAEEAAELTPARIHPPEVLPAVRAHCLAAKEGAVARIDELPFLHRSGKTIYVDVVSRPMCYNGRPGWISFFHDVTDRRQARLALDRQRHTLEHMLQASDHERQLIAYDIHDGLAQYLTGAIMQFQMSQHLREQNPAEALQAFDAGMAMLRQSHAETRRLISGVRPPILDESGVIAAISHLIHEPAFRGGARVEFRSKVAFGRLNPILENVIYRIVQEGLSNARNHSGSKKIVVSLLQSDDRLRIKIQDWGCGFDPKQTRSNRFGLDGMRQRARLLGGHCAIRSRLGKGTAVVVELPLPPQRDEEAAQPG